VHQPNGVRPVFEIELPSLIGHKTRVISRNASVTVSTNCAAIPA
jgi:hypothetical protein